MSTGKARPFSQLHSARVRRKLSASLPGGITANGYEALASGYAGDGGHLNAEGAGRAANAFWALPAEMCGWDGSPIAYGSTIPPIISIYSTGGPAVHERRLCPIFILVITNLFTNVMLDCDMTKTRSASILFRSPIRNGVSFE